MKKKGVSLIFGFIVLVLLVNLVFASDVAYIVKRSRSVDSGFMNVFNEMGLSVDIIESKNIKGVNFSEYKFMFIGDERLKNTKYLPIDEVPSVIANRYYGKEFGISRAGISKLSSNSFLKVKKNNDLIRIYSSPFFSFRRISLPYYYIPRRYGVSEMDSLATTFVGYKRELGDVVAYSNSGVKKCFFGITKTKYWTAEAEDLFKDCVGYVVGGVEELPEPEPELECIVDLDCGVLSSELSCDESSLVNRITTPSCVEGVCADIITEEVQDCEYGCLEGVCLVEDIPECVEDSSCGADSYSDMYCGLDGNVVKDFHEFSCVDEGCVESISLDLVEECFFGCLEGVCLLDDIDEKHDVKLVEDYDELGHEIRIRDSENNILVEDVPLLYCGFEYDFQFKTQNVGDFVEDVDIVLEIKNLGNTIFENVALKEGLISGGDTPAGNKNNLLIDEDVVPGSYIVSVTSSIRLFDDNNLEDNSATREIEIIC